MNEETPREAGDIPPGREGEENPQGADPDTGDTNPERQGPGGPGPTGAPTEDQGQGPSGPPPESIPGDSGQVPSPQQN